VDNNGAVRKRRDRLDVINEMLDVAVDAVVKTRIMYKTNLNFRQFENYVNTLLEADLVEVLNKDGRKLYKTTEKGKVLLGKLRETSWILGTITREETLNTPIIKRGETAYFIRR
jgi:predicted transcriptional regulator